MIEIVIRCDWCNRWGEGLLPDDTVEAMRARLKKRGWVVDELTHRDFCGKDHERDFRERMKGLGLTPKMPPKEEGTDL